MTRTTKLMVLNKSSRIVAQRDHPRIDEPLDGGLVRVGAPLFLELGILKLLVLLGKLGRYGVEPMGTPLPCLRLYSFLRLNITPLFRILFKNTLFQGSFNYMDAFFGAPRLCTCMGCTAALMGNSSRF